MKQVLIATVLALIAVSSCQNNAVSVDNLKTFETEEGYVIPVKGETITLRKYLQFFLLIADQQQVCMIITRQLGSILQSYSR